MSNPYSSFKTNANNEVEGVFINYGDFRVRIARAGGANKKYKTQADRKYRAQRRLGPVTNEQAEKIMYELLISCCILDWQVKGSDGQFVPGMHHPQTAAVIPFTEENVKLVLDQLPEFAAALANEAATVDLFSDEEIEEEAGN